MCVGATPRVSMVEYAQRDPTALNRLVVGTAKHFSKLKEPHAFILGPSANYQFSCTRAAVGSSLLSIRLLSIPVFIGNAVFALAWCKTS